MTLKIIEVNPSIRANVEASGGYCPCAIWQNEDTKCMCKEFREQKEPGLCHCGRFEKVKKENPWIRINDAYSALCDEERK